MKKSASMLVLLLFLSVIIVSLPQIGIVKAEDTIYIRADGTVEGTNMIQRNGSVYTLTGSIYEKRIIVERSSIIIDGNFHTFSGYPACLYGIYMFKVEGVTIKNMVIRNCLNGIFIEDSTHVTISGNTITEIPASFPPNPSAAIILRHGGFHTIVGNNITGNYVGIRFSSSSNNRIFHNNFINNHVDVYDPSWNYPQNTPSTNTWDNGNEGNYWSNYNGTDSDANGIGDTTHIIDENNQDNYPLMAPITIFDAGTWEWTNYNVYVISNSTVSDFSFNPDEGALLRFNVDGKSGTIGFCRVTIPKDLLNTEGNWVVLADGNSVTPTVNEDLNNTYLYFTYDRTTKTIELRGTDVIPEFPSWTPLLFTFIALVVVLAVYRRKLRKAYSVKELMRKNSLGRAQRNS